MSLIFPPNNLLSDYCSGAGLLRLHQVHPGQRELLPLPHRTRKQGLVRRLGMLDS